jgi:ribosomal protein S12 methylthiotransferase accessory factor
MRAHPLSLRSMEDTEPLELAEVEARAARIVSRRTGIVDCVELVETGPCDPSTYWVRATHGDTTPFFGVRAMCDGNASAVDRQTATVKALGESIERYCAACADPDHLVLARFRDLDTPAVRPSDWALFSAEQHRQPGFPVPPFDEDTPIRWVWGFSLSGDHPILVPAAFTFIPYAPVAGEARILPWQVSTGLASHTSWARAALKSLLEVIERDAFMLFWHRRISCPEIDLSHLDDSSAARMRSLRALFDRADVLGYRCDVRLLTLDVPLPIVLVTLSSDVHRPYVVMGCAADCEPETALRLAFEEALLSLHGITTIAERRPSYEPEGPAYSDIGDLLRHAWVYAVDPELRTTMTEQLRPAGSVTVGDLPRGPRHSTLAQLRWLVQQLSMRGRDAVVVDLTTPDIDEIGFKVMRGAIPGMQPLDVDHRHRHLGGPRLTCPISELGIAGARARSGLNPHPHPFP